MGQLIFDCSKYIVRSFLFMTMMMIVYTVIVAPTNFKEMDDAEFLALQSAVKPYLLPDVKIFKEKFRFVETGNPLTDGQHIYMGKDFFDYTSKNHGEELAFFIAHEESHDMTFFYIGFVLLIISAYVTVGTSLYQKHLLSLILYFSALYISGYTESYADRAGCKLLVEKSSCLKGLAFLDSTISKPRQALRFFSHNSHPPVSWRIKRLSSL